MRGVSEAGLALVVLLLSCPLAAEEPIAHDDLESGSTCAWSAALPADLSGAQEATTGANLGSTAGASTATLLAPCSPAASGPWVVYRFTPSVNGDYTIAVTPIDGSYDAVLVVASECRMDAAIQLACKDDGSDAGIETATVPLSSETPIYIFIGGYAEDDAGNFSLAIAPPT